MPAPRHILALVAAALALPAGACAEDEKGLLSANQATELEEKLDDVEKAIDAGSCEYAIKVIGEGRDLADQQQGISGRLKRNIVDGFDRLAARADSECEKDEDEPEKTPTPTPTPTVTEVPTEEPTPEPTVTEVPTEEPTPEPTVTAAPTEPDDGGGFVTPAPTTDTGGVIGGGDG